MPRIAGASAHDFGADPIVVAYGMGVDSTAMFIELRNRRVPIDLIMLACTGSKKMGLLVATEPKMHFALSGVAQ